jgi:hypothetical protein
MDIGEVSSHEGRPESVAPDTQHQPPLSYKLWTSRKYAVNSSHQE